MGQVVTISQHAGVSVRLARFVALGAMVVLLAGCNVLDKTAVGFAGIVSPYKIEVIQGNFISKEQVEALQPGMSREQVKQILGTPLVTSVFHADRWDYVFTLRRMGVESQQRKLTVFFEGNSLKRHEGEDTLTGSRAVDTKAAIVEEFRDRATIMVATEAGAEGIENRVVHHGFAVGTHGIELLQAAVAAAHAGSQDEECWGHSEWSGTREKGDERRAWFTLLLPCCTPQ